jgi:hypothetical protein
MRYKESKSLFFVNLINAFGNAGGFQKVLNRVADEKNWCPIELLANYMQGLHSMSPLLYRTFALEYIPKLKDAVFNNILKSPENNIRNMSKEKYDYVQKALDDLLKRGFSLGEKFAVKIPRLNNSSWKISASMSEKCFSKAISSRENCRG